MTALYHLFNKIYPLSDDFWNDFGAASTENILPRKTILLKQGRAIKKIYFIVKGLARAYYLKNDTDITSRFLRENELIIPINNENVELLEETILIAIDLDRLSDLHKKYPELNFVMRAITEYDYILSEQRSYAMRMKSARQRYEDLLQSDPQIFLRAPLKHIATFLGMKPETLSRIRAQR
jgi:CRP-like cAMP-binding protein